jgi:hypothetical protein
MDLPKDIKDKPELRCDFGKGNYFGYRAVSMMKRFLMDIG